MTAKPLESLKIDSLSQLILVKLTIVCQVHDPATETLPIMSPFSSLMSFYLVPECNALVRSHI